MKPIVVGLDPARPYSAALEWALTEAQLRSAPLELCLAREVPPPVRPDILQNIMIPRSWAQEVVENARAHVEHVAPSVEVATHIREGSPGAVLVEASTNAEAVVVGRQSRGRIASTLLGSTSAQVTANAHAPVIVVDNQTEVRSGKPVVVGVDGSPANRAAITYAFEAAQRGSVPLTALYAWRLDLPEQAALPYMGRDTLRALFQEQTRVLHEALAGYTHDYPDVHVRYLVSRQPPVARLVNEAQSASLLVMGSRGRGGFRGLLLGSTSQGVLHRALPCPIAIVHDRDRAKPDTSR